MMGLLRIAHTNVVTFSILQTTRMAWYEYCASIITDIMTYFMSTNISFLFSLHPSANATRSSIQKI